MGADPRREAQHRTYLSFSIRLDVIRFSTPITTPSRVVMPMTQDPSCAEKHKTQQQPLQATQVERHRTQRTTS
jgi:hypothetical protein